MKKIYNKYIIYYYLKYKNILLQNLYAYFKIKSEKVSDEFWDNLHKHNKEKIESVNLQFIKTTN